MPTITLTDSQKSKKKRGLCITPFCMKPIRIRNKKAFGSKCLSCQLKVYIKNHPLEYTYGVKKRNAKRDKKYFALTFEEFKEFAEKNDYMRKRGTSAKSMHIDRKKECLPTCGDFCKEHGYYKDNIQALTLLENVYKYAKHKRDYTDVPF
jgi:hypothetical protein